MKKFLSFAVVVAIAVAAASPYRGKVQGLVGGLFAQDPSSVLERQAKQLTQERETLKDDLARLEDTRTEAANREDLAVARMNLIRDRYVAGDKAIEFVGRTLSMPEARDQLVQLNRFRQSAAGERTWAQDELKKLAEQLRVVEERLSETETAMRLAPAIENRKRAEALASENTKLIETLRYPKDDRPSGQVRDWAQLEKDAAKLAVADAEKEWLDEFIAKGDMQVKSSDVNLLRDALSN